MLLLAAYSFAFSIPSMISIPPLASPFFGRAISAFITVIPKTIKYAVRHIHTKIFILAIEGDKT